MPRLPRCPVSEGLLCAIVLSVLLVVPRGVRAAETPPNIVVILVDDLGYGDVHCYNPERGKIPTPNIDRLAAQGMRFTDGHSSSGVCSPSRYTLLTGRWHWRTRLQAGIVGVFGAPLIAPQRLTIAGLLKRHGYTTAAIGKWHLGWDWPISTEERKFFPGGGESNPANATVTGEHRTAWREVFAKPIEGGPTARGFDSYFGTDVPNWPPYCFIEDNRTRGIPSEFLPAELLAKQANLASLQGPALAGWNLDAILPVLGERACQFIECSAKRGTPFFLYLPLTSPHTPLAVAETWRERSGLNTYADFVMETDAVVGRILAALEASDVAKHALVVFTSDNGCAPYIGADELERKGHFPSGPLRGYKSDVWEGGHRVPFIVRWPGVVAEGTRCDQLVQQADLMATFADILHVKLPPDAGEDSVSILPLLRGSEKPVRSFAVNQSSGGLPAIRRGPWKLIFGAGSGGWGKGADDQPVQLYNLSDDIGETKNLFAEKLALVAELTALMGKVVADGRSTPGVAQANDKPFDWKRFMPGGTTAKPPGKPKTAMLVPKGPSLVED